MYLTTPHNTANLITHPEKGAPRIAVLETNGISRIHAVFLCKKSQFLVMLDWVRKPKGLVDSFVPLLQPFPVRHHDCSRFVGFKTLQTEAIMPRIHKTKPSNILTAHVSKKLTSRFNVISKTGRSIARKVPFSTAIHLKNEQPELTIKFDSMAVSV